MAENKADKNNKERKKLEIKELETDVLIIGGGTAGCYAAITLGKNSERCQRNCTARFVNYCRE